MSPLDEVEAPDEKWPDVSEENEWRSSLRKIKDQSKLQ